MSNYFRPVFLLLYLGPLVNTVNYPKPLLKVCPNVSVILFYDLILFTPPWKQIPTYIIKAHILLSRGT